MRYFSTYATLAKGEDYQASPHVCGCGTQKCGAITEAVTFLVGIRHSPLTRRWCLWNINPCSYISVLPTDTISQMSIHCGEAFKASRHHLDSAIKSDNEQSELPTVTHQNGFSSTMTIGVPTFNSRLYIYLYNLVALDTCLPKIY